MWNTMTHYIVQVSELCCWAIEKHTDSTESEGEVHLVAIMLKHESDDEWWNCMGADTYNWVMLPKDISQVVADRSG